MSWAYWIASLAYRVFYNNSAINSINLWKIRELNFLGLRTRLKFDFHKFNSILSYIDWLYFLYLNLNWNTSYQLISRRLLRRNFYLMRGFSWHLHFHLTLSAFFSFEDEISVGLLEYASTAYWIILIVIKSSYSQNLLISTFLEFKIKLSLSYDH